MPVAEIRGISLYYETTGEGEPLVLVHGGLLDHFMWMLVVPILAESFRVVTFDWRGHGKSSGEIVSDPLQVVDDLAALIEHLDIVPANVAGQSGGAQIIFHLAARRPDLFRSVSVHEPGFIGLLGDDPVGVVAVKRVAEVTALFRSGDFEGGLRVFLKTIGGDWSLIPPPFQAIFLQNAPNYTGDWFDDPLHPLWNFDEDALRRFPLPTQLTTGDQTASFLSAITKKLADLIPRSELAVIEGGGHGAMLDRPADYATALGEFIKTRASHAV